MAQASFEHETSRSRVLRSARCATLAGLSARRRENFAGVAPPPAPHSGYVLGVRIFCRIRRFTQKRHLPLGRRPSLRGSGSVSSSKRARHSLNEVERFLAERPYFSARKWKYFSSDETDKLSIEKAPKRETLEKNFIPGCMHSTYITEREWTVL